MGRGEPDMHVLPLEPVGGGVWREGALRSGGQRISEVGAVPQDGSGRSADAAMRMKTAGLGGHHPRWRHRTLAISLRLNAFSVLLFSDAKGVQSWGVQSWCGGPTVSDAADVGTCPQS